MSHLPPFEGFSSQETFTPLPDTFFHRLLAEISDADELKVAIYALWRIQNMEGPVRFLREADLAASGARDPRRGVDLAVARGLLLRVESDDEVVYFLNSPRGRLAAEALRSGRWQLSTHTPPPPPTPNLFQLYEENIGPLTPIIADAIQEAERSYPAEWVAEAIAIAATRNKRNWKYVEAILKRWEEEGRAQKQNRRNAEETRRRDVQRKIDEFLGR